MDRELKYYFKFFLIILPILSLSCANLHDFSPKTVLSKDNIITVEGLESYSPINKKLNFNILQNLKNTFKPRKSPELIISQVILAASGKNIISENTEPQDSIKANYSGKNIELIIKGTFNAYNKLKEENFRFSLEPPMIHQSYDGVPKNAVVLNDYIMLTVDSVSETEIKAHINSRSIPDFYLLGAHKITLIADKYFTDTLIEIGKPEELNISLIPEIESVEIIKDDQDRPQALKLTGTHLMLNPKFSYSTIDGTFVFGVQTNILALEDKDKAEAIIYLPDPKNFNTLTGHVVVYSSPFGTSFKRF